VLGTEYPLKFLNASRDLRSVLSNRALQKRFDARYGEQFVKVRDYYEFRRDKVIIEDVSPWLHELVIADSQHLPPAGGRVLV